MTLPSVIILWVILWQIFQQAGPLPSKHTHKHPKHQLSWNIPCKGDASAAAAPKSRGLASASPVINNFIYKKIGACHSRSQCRCFVSELRGKKGVINTTSIRKLTKLWSIQENKYLAPQREAAEQHKETKGFIMQVTWIKCKLSTLQGLLEIKELCIIKLGTCRFSHSQNLIPSKTVQDPN